MRMKDNIKTDLKTIHMEVDQTETLMQHQKGCKGQSRPTRRCRATGRSGRLFLKFLEKQ